MLRVLAQEYFSAKPGPDNATPNIGLHNRLRSVILERFDYSNSQLNDMTLTQFPGGSMTLLRIGQGKGMFVPRFGISFYKKFGL